MISIGELSREEWLEQRRKGIGGSDVAGIAGLSPWATPMRIYLDKIGEGILQEESEAMYWGNVMEEIVAREFERRTGKVVFKPDVMMIHPNIPWAFANIDRGICHEEVGLECKNVSAFAAKDWEDGQVPDYYQLQCQWYMFVTGYKSWWIAALIGGSKFVHYELTANPQIQEYLLQIAGDFWKLVLDRTPPKAETGDAKLLDVLFPASGCIKETKVVASMPELFRRYESACEMEKWALQAKEAAQNEIKELIGLYTSLESGDYVVKWTPYKRAFIDSEALKADGLYDKYAVPRELRKFTVKKIKKEEC